MVIITITDKKIRMSFIKESERVTKSLSIDCRKKLLRKEIHNIIDARASNCIESSSY